jgi:hypothetical protein
MFCLVEDFCSFNRRNGYVDSVEKEEGKELLQESGGQPVLGHSRTADRHSRKIDLKI